MNKPKANQNKAKVVEKKSPLPKPKIFALPGQLRQIVIQALLNSSPKQLTVGEINQLCNTLSLLKEVKQDDTLPV